MPVVNPARWTRQMGLTGLLALMGACGGGDIRGSYDVEIRVEGSRVPIRGTLVLSSTPLDLEPGASTLVVIPDSQIGEEDFEGSSATANSCLSYASTDPRDDRPRSVSLFDVRFRDNRTLGSFPILASSDYVLSVEELRFFANAIGGDVALREPEGERAGRIVGDRIGTASAQLCYDEIARFEERLGKSLTDFQAR